jgi:transposase-like protein
MSSRLEFVILASKPGANIRALCRQHGISAKTGYKFLTRYAEEG